MKILQKFVIVFFLICILSGCVSSAILLERNWNIDLPSDIEEIYYIDSGDSFHGDGYRYSIFSCKKPEVIWERENTVFNYKEFLDDVYKELPVPEEKKVNLFECSYYYYQIAEDGSKLLLIYDNECMKLYSIEEIL